MTTTPAAAVAEIRARAVELRRIAHRMRQPEIIRSAMEAEATADLLAAIDHHDGDQWHECTEPGQCLLAIRRAGRRAVEVTDLSKERRNG